MISKDNASHFRWNDVCDGWILADLPNLHVQQELMPPGTGERLHLHSAVSQVYYVLSGTATADCAGATEKLEAGQALLIPPGAAHRIRNLSSQPVEFLVVSTSAPRADRADVDDDAVRKRWPAASDAPGGAPGTRRARSR